MIMIPNPPKFFESSLRHVLWNIAMLDQSLTVIGRQLAAALDKPAREKAREQCNLLLDQRLEFMRLRDDLRRRAQGEAAA